MNDEKLKSIIARKRSEIIALEKQEVEIRKGITEDNYTESELANTRNGDCILPESITYKLRSMWQTTSKLRIEIKCIERILRNKTIRIVGCAREVRDVIWCDKCEHELYSDECTETRKKLGNGFIITDEE